jgi:hypothetical protein
MSISLFDFITLVGYPPNPMSLNCVSFDFTAFLVTSILHPLCHVQSSNKYVVESIEA